MSWEKEHLVDWFSTRRSASREAHLEEPLHVRQFLRAHFLGRCDDLNRERQAFRIPEIRLGHIWESNVF